MVSCSSLVVCLPWNLFAKEIFLFWAVLGVSLCVLLGFMCLSVFCAISIIFGLFSEYQVASLAATVKLKIEF